MQKAEDYYGDSSYGELFQTWSVKYGSANYTANDLEAIHRRWKALGKQIAHGPEVAIRATPRRRRGNH
jgi:hypothetical protein